MQIAVIAVTITTGTVGKSKTAAAKMATAQNHQPE
jgi:hypothetical protein